MNGKPNDRAARRQQAVSMSGVRWLVAASLALIVLSFAPGCSDSSRRMGEFETLQYKRGLLAERHEEISPDQAEKLMYYPGRTQAEIDAYFETLAEEQEARREAEATELRRTRSGSGTAGSTSTGTAPGGVSAPPPEGNP